ncbi:MAG: GNAT family N-acetyltransferase [Magnetovibrionaceae bacterium]
MAVIIKPDDLNSEAVSAIVATHLSFARASSPACQAFALDVEALKAPEMSFWVAWWNAKTPVGCCGLLAREGGFGEIKSMHTLEAHRGHGIGALLVDHVLKEAGRRGYGRVGLETGKGEPFFPARRLYARAGFVACDAFPPYENDTFSYCMMRAV